MHEPELTELPTSYVNLFGYVQRENISSFWTHTYLSHLRQMNVKFKALGNYAFRACQTSTIDPQKWYLLDCLVDAIKGVGGILFLHRGLYESSHKIFKTLYAKSSK